MPPMLVRLNAGVLGDGSDGPPVDEQSTSPWTESMLISTPWMDRGGGDSGKDCDDSIDDDDDDKWKRWRCFIVSDSTHLYTDTGPY